MLRISNLPVPALFLLLAAGLLLALPGSGLAGAGEPLVAGDLVLRSDTVWSGSVTVDGVVVVGRGATLFIEPGTTVSFRRKDGNNDGIGDGEIRVLGRLLARGTETARIRFRSAEDAPAPDDWSYVLLFASGRESALAFCDFRHAFTGLQVHFSTARVSDCLFAGNREGIRFGRARLRVEHNTIRDNGIGIRFTRMEGPVIVKSNEITANRTGIFLAPSGQNIMNFFEPDRGGTAWNTGRLLITANNIYANSRYNLALGEKQLWDLDVAGNWWGSADPGEIEASIFDRERDRSLGRALFRPHATARIEETPQEVRGAP